MQKWQTMQKTVQPNEMYNTFLQKLETADHKTTEDEATNLFIRENESQLSDKSTRKHENSIINLFVIRRQTNSFPSE
jgi:hypothetical protein